MTQPDVRPTEDLAGAAPADGEAPVTLGTLFAIFLKSGLAFGGGTGITALLVEEFVDRRKALTRAEFMAIYGLGRIVPSGTVTTLAVAFGYRYQRFAGTLAALVAMILPSFTLTVLLTIAYTQLAGSPAFEVVNVTLMPAALAVIIVAALKLLQEFFYPGVELALAVGAFVAILLDANPSIVLIVGGLIGAVGIRPRRPRAGGA